MNQDNEQNKGQDSTNMMKNVVRYAIIVALVVMVGYVVLRMVRNSNSEVIDMDIGTPSDINLTAVPGLE